MKLSTTKISSTEAADIYLNWYPEQEVKNAFREGSRAQQMWDEFLIGEFTPYVPMETGMLAHSATIATTIGSGVIIYRTPYARFLYYGKVMVDPKTGSPYARSGITKKVIDQDIKFSTAANPKAGSLWDRRAGYDRMEVWQKFYAGIIAREFGGK